VKPKEGTYQVPFRKKGVNSEPHSVFPKGGSLSSRFLLIEVCWEREGYYLIDPAAEKEAYLKRKLREIRLKRPEVEIRGI